MNIASSLNVYFRNNKFTIALQRHGRQWKVIEGEITTRNSSQIRTHAQKFFIRLKEITGLSDDAILAYVRERPACYFIDEDSRFARLGVEEGHRKSTLQENSNSSVIKHKRDKSEADSNIQPIASKFKLCEPLALPSASFTAIYKPVPQKPTISSMISPQPRSGTVIDGPSPGETLQKLYEENRSIRTALEKARAGLAEYCQVVAVSCLGNGAFINGNKDRLSEYLYTNGVTLQLLIRDIMTAQAKESSLVAHLMAFSQLGSSPSPLPMSAFIQ